MLRSLFVGCLVAFGCSTAEAPAPAATPRAKAPGLPQPETTTMGTKPTDVTIAPEPTDPVTIAAAAEAHAHVQQRMHGEALEAHRSVHFAPIEDPSGHALAKFHAALRTLQTSTRADAKVRIAFYGASSVAADRYTGYLRGYLQHRFGDAGVGFVALVPLWRWHRHDSAQVRASKHWRIEHGQRETGKLDGHYGLLGASAHSENKRAWTSLANKKSAVSPLANSSLLELHYLAQPSGGSFDLKLGNSHTQKILDPR